MSPRQPASFVELFWQPIKQQKKTLTIVFIGAAIVALTQASVIFIFGPVFKALFSLQDQSALQISDFLPASFNIGTRSYSPQELFTALPLILAVVATMRGLAMYLTQLYQERLSLEIADYFRCFAFSKIIRSTYLKIAEKSAAEWMSQVMNDVMFLQQRFSELLKSLVKDGLAVMGAVIALALINWQLTLLLLAVAIPALFLLGIAARKISLYTETVQRKLGILSAHSANFTARYADITVHKGKERELFFYEQENRDLLINQRRSIALRSAFAPSIEWLGFITFAAFLAYYSATAESKNVNPTFLMQFTIALGICIRPLRNLGEQISRYQETKGAMHQNFSNFIQTDNQPYIKARESKKFSSQHSTIDISEVHVGLGKGTVITARDLSLPPGATVALKGASGSGKSSLLKCLAGLIEPNQWKSNILWREFVEATAFVSQTPFIFEDSLRANILYGTKQRDGQDDKIIHLAKMLGLGEILNAATDLSRTLSSLQTELSGGQKQRLTILRGLLQNRPVLLLDEATSALDSRTENMVLRFLCAEMQRRGGRIIFVTHRPIETSLFTQIWQANDCEIYDSTTVV